jgi:hypothetical protein
MSHGKARLRRGEVIAGAAAVALLALTLLAGAYRTAAGPGAEASITRTGWAALPVLRWFVVVSALSALALAFFQATRPAPALPVSFSVITTALGTITSVALAIRLASTAASPRAGAWLALTAAAVMTAGAFVSMREEDGWTPDAEHPIETVALGPAAGP